ncbi:MAG TPA: RHS repeat-associated core domain-containing protein, partial [Bryobacteraceae bacterium]|nr:RHS repeat-associated core domain-containing protein [Bryobacteraceae bacterium]
TNGVVSATYTYDGDGRRVQKVSGSTTTNYVYDASGQLAAEYASAAAAASPCGTCYLTADTLGSTRMITDETATPRECHDYLPFGEEITRTAGCYGGTTSNTLKFTGKERDVETGLDYFGARHLSAAQGRWTSPDWSATPQAVPYAALDDPQSLNLYAYVRNNPLRTADVDGHQEPPPEEEDVERDRDPEPFGREEVKPETPEATQREVPASPAGEQWLNRLTPEQRQSMADRLSPSGCPVLPETEPAGPTMRAGPTFSVSPGGDVIPVPKGAAGPGSVVNPRGNTTGFAYTGGSGGPGLNPKVSGVRIMDPTPARGSSPGYSGGYVTYQNAAGQGVNPQTGRTVPNSDPLRHIPLTPPKTTP